MASEKLSVSVPTNQWEAVQALVGIRLGDLLGDSWIVQYALGNFLLSATEDERAAIVDEMTRRERERLAETLFVPPGWVVEEPIEF